MVDTFSGSVRIVEDPDAKVIEVVVIQSAEVETEAAMDSRLEPLTLKMSQQGGVVALSARYAKPVSWSWKSWPPVNLAYEIKVPRRCDVQVTTHDGSILLGALEGRVVLENDSGSIFTGEIQGAVTARSNTGDVAITAASGPIDVSTLVGRIVVGRAGDRTKLSSQGGYIELQRARGEVVIRGDGSDAKVGFASPLKHPSDIKLSGGELALVLDRDSACTLNVHASMFGKVVVRGELPLKITAGGDGRSSLEAMVNGGGPVITARVSGGSVVVRGVEPLPVAWVGSSTGGM